MTENLKSCPFCGGEAKCIEFYGMYHVICCDCYIAGRDTLTRDKAIESWNSRPIEDALQKELDESREDNADNIESHVAELEWLRKLLKSCCNEFVSFKPCAVVPTVDANGRCTARSTCAIYRELTKGA